MPTEGLLADRTSHINNVSQSRVELQNDIAAVNSDLNTVLKDAKPLLERHRKLQMQMAQLDPNSIDNVQQGIVSALSMLETDASTTASPKSSPLRKSLMAQDTSPGVRLRAHGSNFNGAAKRLRYGPSPARQHDIDLATEIGEGLVEEVRKLQAQLYEKDELLKDLSRSRVKQERICDELEGKLRNMSATEERLKSENWELELKVQQMNEDQISLTENNAKMESELSKHIINKNRQAEEIEKLHEEVQMHEQVLATMKTQHAAALIGQKEIHNDLRGEIAGLLRNAEQSKVELEAQKLSAASRALTSSPAKMPAEIEAFMDDPETPPGSPPLSPIKGTPHRNATLESETLKGTLFHNQAKMLRQRKDLEREKAQRLQLQRQVKELEDELASLRQARGSKTIKKQKSQQSTSKRSLHSRDVFNVGRRPHSEISFEEDADSSWEAAAEHESVSELTWSTETSPRMTKAEEDKLLRSDDFEARYRSGSPSQAWHSRVRSRESSVDRDSSDVESIATARRNSNGFGPRAKLFRNVSATFETPRALDSELQDIFCSSPVQESLTPNAGSPRIKRVETCDACIMTDEPWPTTNVFITSAAPETRPLEKLNEPELVFIIEDPTFDNRADDSSISDQDSMTLPEEPLTFATHDALEESMKDSHTSESNQIVVGLAAKSDAGDTVIIPSSEIEDLAVKTPPIPTTVESSTREIVDNETPCDAQQVESSSVKQQALAVGQIDEYVQQPAPRLSDSKTVSSPAISGSVDADCLITDAPASPQLLAYAGPCFDASPAPEVILLGYGKSARIDTQHDTQAAQKIDSLNEENPQSIRHPIADLQRPIEHDTTVPTGLQSTMQLEAATPSSNASDRSNVSPFLSTNDWSRPRVREEIKPSSTMEPLVSIPESRLQALIRTEEELRRARLAVDDLTRLYSSVSQKPVSQAMAPSEDLSTTEKTKDIKPTKHEDMLQTITTTSKNMVSELDAELASGTDSAMDSDSVPSAERIRQLRTQRFNYGSPIAKAERVLGKPPSEDTLTTSVSISHSLRSQTSSEALQPARDSRMAPPLAPSFARDTLRRKQNNARATAVLGERDATVYFGNMTPSMPTRSYSQRSMSSLSSFASEIDEHFNTRYRAPDVQALPENPTDPATIESITRTMIGMSMYKYTRRAGRQGLSENRHKRYFWIHPYTKTLYWSVYNPVNAPEGAIIKSAPIITLHIEEDHNPNPPGLHQRSLCIETPRRTLKVTAMQTSDHEDWVRALNFLLFGSVASDQTAEAAQETDAIIRDFNPGINTSPRRQSPVRIGRTSLSETPRSTRYRSESQTLQGQNSISRKLGSYFSSVRSSKGEALTTQVAQPFATLNHSHKLPSNEPLTLDNVADGVGLENVRACCGGKHDVRDLCKRPSTSRSSSRCRVAS